MTTKPETLGQRILVLRALNGDESQRALAIRVDSLGFHTNKDEINRIERGVKTEDTVNPLTVLGIAMAYDVKVTDLSERVAQRLDELESRMAAAQNWKYLSPAAA